MILVTIKNTNVSLNIKLKFSFFIMLCHTYKLFKCMILKRLSRLTEEMIIDQQAGFRHGKSTTGQLLNLTQNIEDGLEQGVVTGTVCIDLSTTNYCLTRFTEWHLILSLLTSSGSCSTNRRYFVELNGQRSRWRNQKNGLPQSSVLSPVLFMIYTNDQQVLKNTRSFIYADDLCIATQDAIFKKTESTVSDEINNIGEYYAINHMRVKPKETHICNSKWGANPAIIRRTAVAPSYPTAEYVCLVW